MKSTSQFIFELKKMLSPHDREELIKSFQEYIWGDNDIEDKYLEEILVELAYDLDFYEPNVVMRKEEHSYYGDDRLTEIILRAISAIEARGQS